MTDPTCATPTCLTDRQVKEAVLTTKMNSIIGLCLVAVGLLSYSVFWQAPTIRAEMAKEINRLDTADREMKSGFEEANRAMRADFERLCDRVSALELKE
jgi:hypothetical protein